MRKASYLGVRFKYLLSQPYSKGFVDPDDY